MRRPFVAGNWKMNTSMSEAETLVRKLYQHINKNEVDIAICPPFTHLATVLSVIQEQEQQKTLAIKVGAQNAHWEEKGAFTGEISAPVLKEIGCSYVILGHSERRTLFLETSENVSKKAAFALHSGLLPIICIGETLEEREQGVTETVLKTQISGSLAGLTPPQIETCTIAYEPVWAIGTGKTASPEMAQQVHASIRNFLSENYGSSIANSIRIQYGGSVKPQNIRDLISQPDIDGALVGGASLKADSFADIVNFCKI